MQGVSTKFTQMVGSVETMQVFVNPKVGLEGCSSWVARLGPHPHAPLKLGARLSHSAGGFFRACPPVCHCSKASYTPFYAKKKKHCKPPNLPILLIIGGDSQEPEGGRSPLRLHSLATRRRPSPPPHIPATPALHLTVTQFKLQANKTTMDQTLKRGKERDSSEMC